MGEAFLSRVRLGLLAAAVLVACVDGTGPGRFGQLRIRPSYTAGDEPGAIGAGLDSAAVRVTRVAEPAIPLIDTTVTYQSDTAPLGWILDLREEAESLHVAVTLWGGTAQLYDGDGDVLVRDGAIGSAAAVEPVAVAYVGPAIVATVTVSPADATLDAIGATRSLAAEARDRHGLVVADAAMSWTSENPAVATVDAVSGVVTAVGNGSTTVTASSGAGSGSATFVVAQRVAAISVSPAATSLTALGATQTLAAQAQDANGHSVTGAAVAWSSDAPEVARVDPTTGLVTAVAGGSAIITATSDGVAASALVTVNPIADVATITVTPATSTLLAVGATRQFTAVARDAAGVELAGVQFTWGSTTGAVATIDPASGVAQAVGHGATTVSAGAGAVVGTAVLTVDLSATIASVVVTPGAATLTSLGAQQPFTAAARDAGGAPVPVAGFDWSSTVPDVATVDGASGRATAVSHGATTIRATVAGVSGGASLTVDLASSVASVTVTPATATLTAVGATQQFVAVARDAGGSALPGVPVAFTSGTPGVATVDALTGLATAVSHGATTITAGAGTVSGQATLQVDLIARVASVSVTPAGATLTAVGATQAFTATARDAGGALLPGITFGWSSAVPAVGTVAAATGLATATGHGQTAITATAGAAFGQALLSVDLSATIAAVEVAPATATLTALGATRQFMATARDAAGAVVPVASFTWSSGNVAVATVDPATGIATAAGHGTTTISAVAGAATGSATLSVDLAGSVTTVVVSPATTELTALGATQQFSAEARDAAGRPLPGVLFAWATTAPAVATIDPVSGQATATGHGATTITASTGAATGSADLTVDLAGAVTSVVVTPAAATLTVVGSTRQFTAVARDAAGTALPGVTFAWASTVPTVATVHPTDGIASAVAHGTTTITAASGSVHGQAVLTVDLTTSIASVVVSPSAVTIAALGATQQFTATARDAAGAVLPVVEFAWSSANPAIATVAAGTGVATAVGHGTAAIAAAVGGVSGSAVLTVDFTTAAAFVIVTPGEANLTALDGTQRFSAEVRDAANHVLPGLPVTWSSSAPGVAMIDSAGLATATGHGSTTIAATVGTVQGSAHLAVDLVADVASVIVSPASTTLQAIGSTQPFVAEARDAAGTLLSGITFAWTSLVPAVAAVDAVTGIATAAGHGATTITATAGGASGTASLTVDLSTGIAVVTVTPATATLTAVGATQQFTAQARDADGAIVPVVAFAWSSSVPGVATIGGATGLAAAHGHGATSVTAAVGGVTGSATLTVDLTGTVATVLVIPSSKTLKALGTTQEFVAEARDAAGVLVGGVSFVWSSAHPGVATIDSLTGVATAVANGTTTITATAGAVSGTATLTVVQQVTSVVVSPVYVTVVKGQSQQFTAQAFDANGHVVAGVTFAWSSSNTSIAKVGATGLATTCGYGTVKIKATTAGITGWATLVVKRPY